MWPARFAHHFLRRSLDAMTMAQDASTEILLQPSTPSSGIHISFESVVLLREDLDRSFFLVL